MMTRQGVLNRGGFHAAHTIMVHGMLLTGLLLLMLFAVPRMKKVYLETLNIDVPNMTHYIVVTSEMMSSHVIVTLLLAAAFMTGDAVLVWQLEGSGRMAWGFAWGVIVSCLLVFAVFVMILGLLLPFVTCGWS